MQKYIFFLNKQVLKERLYPLLAQTECSDELILNYNASKVVSLLMSA